MNHFSFLTKFTVCFFVCFLLVSPANAQKNKAIIDSLEKSTLTLKDTDLVKIYNELTWQYRTVSSEKAIEYGNKALELGTKTGFNKGIAQAYNDLGILFYDKQDNTKALEFYHKAMNIRLKMNDKKGVAGIYSKIGVMFQKKGDYVTALENQQQALKIYEEIKYDYGISYALNNIAILDYDIGNYDEALKYNLKSAELKEKIGDKLGLSGSYVNIANIYFTRKDYDKAIDYNLKSLETCRKIGDKEYLSATLNNLSSAYLNKNDLKEALKFAQESYQLRKELNDKKAMISCLVNMAHIYLKLNEAETALNKLNEAFALSKQSHSLPEMSSLYGTYTEYYESKGDFKKALENQKLQFFYRDSVLNEDLNSKITEMNTKYETEKKEKELIGNKFELNNKELELSKQKTQRNILIIAFILILSLSYLLYSRYRFRQKIIFNQEIMKQQELRSKAIIEAEEKERIRIARELHDGVGQQLSAVKLNMSNLESLLEIENNEQKLIMKNAMEIIDDSVKELRSVSHSMMPNALLKSGLGTAIREFLNRISSDKLKIELEIHGLNERLESTTETILFRVMQEIVNNIIKHSQANKVNIQIIKHDNEITMVVEDNGVGFDLNKVKEGGIGLKNIQSRIAYLNGTVNIDSQPGKGTTIIIEAPIK